MFSCVFLNPYLYMIGRPKKWKPKPKRDVVPEPNVSRMGKVWQALECLEKEVWHSKKLEEPPPYEKACLFFCPLGVPISLDDVKLHNIH